MSKSHHSQLVQHGLPAVFSENLLVVLLGLFAIWSVYVAELVWHVDLKFLGVFPRKPEGLIGIVGMHFVHGDFEHIVSNSVPLLIMGMLCLGYYGRLAFKLIPCMALTTGLLVWIFARPAYHIGASGLVYALAGFLFSGGLFYRDRRAVAAMLLVALLYGASIWGILPYDEGISWEGHLMGGLTGFFFAAVVAVREEKKAKQQVHQDPPQPGFLAGVDSDGRPVWHYPPDNWEGAEPHEPEIIRQPAFPFSGQRSKQRPGPLPMYMMLRRKIRARGGDKAWSGFRRKAKKKVRTGHPFDKKPVRTTRPKA